jgi:hypothetical protein
MSQVSQGTSPVVSAAQETRQDSAAPFNAEPVVGASDAVKIKQGRGHTIASALAVAIPIAVLYGFVVGFLVHMLLW